MFSLAFDRAHRVLHLKLTGVYTTEDLDRFDVVALHFVNEHGPVHMLLDFSGTTAMAAPASKLRQRGQLPPLCPAHLRVMVMPRPELQEFGLAFAEFQRQAGHPAPLVVASLEEGMRALSLGADAAFEPVPDPPAAQGWVQRRV
jgi:hypothetical protein